MAKLVRLDKIKATAHIVNIVCESDLTNGTLVELGALRADGEGYDVAAPVDVTNGRYALHVSVPMGYTEPDFEEDFVLKAGKVGRGYILEKGDIITITDDGFTTVPAVNDIVTGENGKFTLTKNASATTQKVQFIAIEKTKLNGLDATTLEVL